MVKMLLYIKRMALSAGLFVFLCIPIRAESSGEWKQLPSIPAGRFAHACVTVNGFLYVIGGHSGAGGTDSVFFTKANPGGSLKPWQTTTPLPKKCNEDRAIAHNDQIYVLGGMEDEKGLSEKVYFGTVTADGTIAEWKTTTPLPRPMGCGAVVLYNDKIYYIGGWYSREVFFAPIRENGSLGEWQKTRNLLSPRKDSRAFALNGYLYLVGGNAGHEAETRKENVYRAKVKEDGTLGNWLSSISLPIPSESFVGILVKDQIFIIGGAGTGNKTFITKIDQEGELGEWREGKLLPEELWSLDGVYLNGWIYIIGGFFKRPDGRPDVTNAVYGTLVE